MESMAFIVSENCILTSESNEISEMHRLALHRVRKMTQFYGN